jgi:hypothetical protein
MIIPLSRLIPFPNTVGASPEKNVPPLRGKKGMPFLLASLIMRDICSVLSGKTT